MIRWMVALALCIALPLQAQQHPKISMDTSMARVLATEWTSLDTMQLACAYGPPTTHGVVAVDSLVLGTTCIGQPNGVIAFVHGFGEADRPGILQSMKDVLTEKPSLAFACEVWATERQQMYGVWMTTPRSACAISEATGDSMPIAPPVSQS